MNFKELKSSEIENLSRVDRYDYYSKLELHRWSSKSYDEKCQEVFSLYDFFIGRRGIEEITLEEIIDIATKNELNENSKYISKLIALYNEKILVEEKFTFFWETKSLFSQWYKSDFKASSCLIRGLGTGEPFKTKKRDLFGNFLDSELLDFSSAEQFMMFHKAIIFLDLESAKKILNTNNVRKIKELGREVKNYKEEVWVFYRSKVVYEANKAKFTQNAELKEALLLTANTTLVESAPNDKIWGIGLAKDDLKSKSRKTWEGKNLLGEILTILREEISQENYL